jgi:radical SAM superfamily enzyme
MINFFRNLYQQLFDKNSVVDLDLLQDQQTLLEDVSALLANYSVRLAMLEVELNRLKQQQEVDSLSSGIDWSLLKDTDILGDK